MAVVNRLKSILRQNRGDDSISFLFTTAMLIFVFATLVAALIYIMQYYNASYLCRRVVRNIEITGQYDETETKSILDGLDDSGLDNIAISVDAVYYNGTKIQLRQKFIVTLTASYSISVIEIGADPIVISLPIKVKVAGLSEVYWN